MSKSTDALNPGTVVLAGIVPIGAAAALVSVRGHVSNADIALMLAVVVVAAAVAGGRAVGAIAAVVSTMAFDFFHTRPYLSLKITSAEDIETTALLLAVGIAVGQVAVMSRRRRYEAVEGRSELESLHRVLERAARGTDTSHFLAMVRAEMTEVLSLATCTFRPEPPPPGFPCLEPSGWIDAGRIHRYEYDGFQLPPGGVVLPIRNGGASYGHLLCVPIPGTAVSSGRRRVAVALADVLGLVLATMAVVEERAGSLSPQTDPLKPGISGRSLA